MTANEAEVIAHVAGGRIWDLARQGRIEAIFLNVRRGGNRTECWDPTGIAEPMDCRSRRGARALHGATRGGGSARPEALPKTSI